RLSWRGLQPGASTPGDSRLITPETTPLSIPTAFRTAPSQSTHRSDESAYFAELQNSVERALCRNDDTRLGTYRAAFQVWIEESGRIRALHLLGSTGNESLDAAITTRITSDTVVPPPRDLPQPITIILRAASSNGGCSRSAGARL
ncbi:TonB C-terminal domain-containing protein, partial [Bradyrhizobium sp. LeoA1S1]